MITHREKDQLRPCPFCGSADLDVTQWIECNGCGAIGPTPSDHGDLSSWNNRAELYWQAPQGSGLRRCVLDATYRKFSPSIRARYTPVMVIQEFDHDQ